MYERQDGTGLEIGSYAHRPILHDPDEIPSIEEAALSPTEFPFTQADFDAADGARARADAGDRRRRDGRREVRDQRPPLADARRHADPRRDARGARASGRPPPSGSRRARASASRVAEWMVHGESEIDLHSSDIARFYEHQKTRAHVQARAGRGLQQDLRDRPPGRAVGVEPRRPAVAVPRARAGARRRLLRGRRLGAAALVRVERAAARGVRRPRRRAARPSGTSRWWSPIINAEHLAMRERAAMFDLSAFAIFDIAGPGALDARAARRDAADGRRASAGSSTRRCSRRAAASAPT